MNTSATALISQLLAEDDHFKKAQLVDTLRRDECISVKEIAEKIQKHPSYISHLTRLLKLPALVIDGYYSKQISLSHLVILSRLEKMDEIEEVYQIILSKNLTSSQTEDMIRFKKYHVDSHPDRVPPEELSKLVTSVQDKYKEAQVKVIQTRIKGKIVIELKGGNKKTSDFLRMILASITMSQDPFDDSKMEELMVLE